MKVIRKHCFSSVNYIDGFIVFFRFLATELLQFFLDFLIFADVSIMKNADIIKNIINYQNEIYLKNILLHQWIT